MSWFLDQRQDLARYITCMEPEPGRVHAHRLLALAFRLRLARVLRYLFDEEECLAPYGIRSLSRVHQRFPYICRAAHEEYRVDYQSAESKSHCLAATRTGADRSGFR